MKPESLRWTLSFRPSTVEKVRLEDGREVVTIRSGQEARRLRSFNTDTEEFSSAELLLAAGI